MDKVYVKDIGTQRAYWGTESVEIGLLDGLKKTGFHIVYYIQSCRAYLGDIIFSNKFTVKGHYYKEGFDINKGKTVLAVRVSTRKQEQAFENLNWLHKKEKEAGVGLTRIYKTDNPEIWVYVGSKKWKDSAWKIMLYSFYVKCSASNKVPEDTDKSYWSHLIKKNKKGIKNETILLKHVKDRPEVEEAKKSDYGINFASMHTIHGFISICNGQNKTMHEKFGLTKSLESIY